MSFAIITRETGIMIVSKNSEATTASQVLVVTIRSAPRAAMDLARPGKNAIRKQALQPRRVNQRRLAPTPATLRRSSRRAHHLHHVNLHRIAALVPSLGRTRYSADMKPGELDRMDSDSNQSRRRIAIRPEPPNGGVCDQLQQTGELEESTGHRRIAEGGFQHSAVIISDAGPWSQRDVLSYIGRHPFMEACLHEIHERLD